MKRALAGSILLCGSLLGAMLTMHAAEPQEETPPVNAASTDKGDAQPVDVTAEVRKYNSDEFASPPTEFRTGKAMPRELDDKAITPGKAGFIVQLPSGAPVPTPTVYEGKVYVSGGFHSKEYYCFDAVTGKLVWAIDIDDDGPSSAVVSDGIAVFNTESCTIFAVNALTGSHLWSHWLGDPLTSTPAIAGGRVFTSYPAAGGGGGEENAQQLGNQGNAEQNLEQNKDQPQTAQQTIEQDEQSNGNAREAIEKDPSGKERPPMSHVLACLDLKSGKILWQRWIDSDVMTSPVCVDDEVYVTTFAGTVMKFRQKDGEILSAKRQRATSAPVVAGKDVLFTQRADAGKDGAQAEEALANVARSGEKLNYQVNKKEAQYLDKVVQLKSAYNAKAQQLDAGNGFGGGAPQAANPDAAVANIGQATVSSMQAFQGSRALVSGGCSFTCPGNEIICNDNRSGGVKWKVKLDGDLAKEGGFLVTAPAAAGKSVFVATLPGHVLQINPADGKIVQRYEVGSPVRFQPAIVDGRIYVGTQDGRLVCLDTKDRTLTGWSTWGGNAAHTGVGPVK
jgi:outer membrane protein assembly factor BamB